MMAIIWTYKHKLVEQSVHQEPTETPLFWNVWVAHHHVLIAREVLPIVLSATEALKISTYMHTKSIQVNLNLTRLVALPVPRTTSHTWFQEIISILVLTVATRLMQELMDRMDNVLPLVRKENMAIIQLVYVKLVIRIVPHVSAQEPVIVQNAKLHTSFIHWIHHV